MDPTASPQADEASRAGRDLPEEFLQHAERLRVALAAAPIVVFNQDRELRYTWIGNPGIGFGSAEVLGRTDEELLGAVVARPLTDIKRRVLETGRAERQEVNVARAGQSAWYDLTVEPLREGQGSIAGITCVAVDITERKRSEEALRKSEALFHTVVDNSRDGINLLDLKTGRYILMSPAQVALTGFTCDEINHLTAEEAYARVHPEDRALSVEQQKKVAEGQATGATVEYRWRIKSGEYRWFSDSRSLVRDAQGTAVALVGVSRDISERKRLEAERAAALARLAIVEEYERHRLSRELHDQTAQRLVALAVELKNLETSLAAGKSPTERLQGLRRAVDELQQQVRQIAWDLRAGELVEDELESALREYAEEWAGRAQVAVDCECRGLGGQPLPTLVKSTLYRVAQEALANVEKHARARRASILLERADSLIRLTVEDDGCGFDPEVHAKTPGATDRLGLLGMRERVTLAGGTLVLESSPGAGTTVLVRLPIPNAVQP